MRISKKILITILSLTLLFYIGCDNENKTGGGGVSPTSPEADSGGSGTGSGGGTGSGTERNLSYYTGDWYGEVGSSGGEQHLITIKNDGSIISYSVADGSSVSVASSYITKNSDTSYTFDIPGSSGSGMNATINFTSDTKGKMSLSSGSSSMDVNITKK